MVERPSEFDHARRVVLEVRFDEGPIGRDAGLSVMIQWMKQTDAPDRHAREIRFIVVPRPADFWERAVLDGSPPKVIRVRLGNCTTDDVRTLLSEQA